MQWSAILAHNQKVGGSNPPSARVVVNQPPRGATWVTLMIEKYMEI